MKEHYRKEVYSHIYTMRETRYGAPFGEITSFLCRDGIPYKKISGKYSQLYDMAIMIRKYGNMKGENK
jgi:hypothetical protein